MGNFSSLDVFHLVVLPKSPRSIKAPSDYLNVDFDVVGRILRVYGNMLVFLLNILEYIL